MYHSKFVLFSVICLMNHKQRLCLIYLFFMQHVWSQKFVPQLVVDLFEEKNLTEYELCDLLYFEY